MAQKFYNFQDAPLGDIPPYMELRRNAVAADYQISEDVDGKFLSYSSTSASSAKGVAYPDIPSEGATEIYAELHDPTSSSPSSGRLVLFATDSPDNEYGAYNQSGSLTLYRRVGGSFTSLGVFSAGISQRVPQCIRLKVTPGSPNIIQTKVWMADDAEPAEWSIETTDNSLMLTAGWSGHVGFAQNHEVQYREVGIGTNGDPAPTGPVDGEIDVSISATELGYDVASVGIRNAIQLGVSAVESGSDTSTVTLNNPVSVEVVAHEAGQDTASITLDVSQDVIINIAAQEQGADTAQITIIAGQIYVIPDGCTSIEDVSPVYSLSDTSPIYSIEDVTCQLV